MTPDSLGENRLRWVELPQEGVQFFFHRCCSSIATLVSRQQSRRPDVHGVRWLGDFQIEGLHKSRNSEHCSERAQSQRRQLLYCCRGCSEDFIQVPGVTIRGESWLLCIPLLSPAASYRERKVGSKTAKQPNNQTPISTKLRRICPRARYTLLYLTVDID